jgi:hypothetical protein
MISKSLLGLLSFHHDFIPYEFTWAREFVEKSAKVYITFHTYFFTRATVPRTADCPCAGPGRRKLEGPVPPATTARGPRDRTSAERHRTAQVLSRRSAVAGTATVRNSTNTRSAVTHTHSGTDAVMLQPQFQLLRRVTIDTMRQVRRPAHDAGSGRRSAPVNCPLSDSRSAAPRSAALKLTTRKSWRRRHECSWRSRPD